MTKDERQALLQLIGQVLIDNAGNRITRALVVGICGDLENQIAVDPPVEPPKEPQ